MATTLTAVFELIDKMSDKMDAIANGGENVIANWERMGDAADHAQEIGVAAAAGVANSIVKYNNAMEDAAGTTDYWTEAIGNFDKSAMEATFTTEELVEMGYKSAKALEEEQSVLELAYLAMNDLNNATETSITVHNKLEDAMSKASQVAEVLSDNDKISEQTKEALQDATEKVTAAFEELEATQRAAQDAMDNYNAVAKRGTATITELEAAALDAATAADNLVAANDKAAAATDELSKASESAADEAENVNEKGVGAIEGIAGALAAAGITAKIYDVSTAVYDLADDFSEAEKTI